MDIETECLKMEPGETQTFEIDRDLDRFELIALVARLSKQRPGIGYLANRSVRTVTIQCYHKEHGSDFSNST